MQGADQISTGYLQMAFSLTDIHTSVMCEHDYCEGIEQAKPAQDDLADSDYVSVSSPNSQQAGVHACLGSPNMHGGLTSAEGDLVVP